MTLVSIKEKNSNETIYVNLDQMTYFRPTSGELYLENGSVFMLDDKSNKYIFNILIMKYDIN